MKLTTMTSLACASLLLAAATANAQTSYDNSSNASSAQQGKSEMPSPGSQSTGNNLDTSSKSPRVDPSSAPPTAGQDKTHGNNMVSPNGTQQGGDMKQANASRPDFSTLDKKNKGKLTAADVRTNQWLSKNFSKCDTDSDGTLSREEYESCH